MNNYTNLYLSAVENHLRQMREHLLFLDTPFSELLPTGVSMDCGEKASWLSDRLLYALISTSENTIDTEQSKNARIWLYSTIHYLLTSCSECDHTASKVELLVRLPQPTRVSLFDDNETYHNVRTATAVPALLSDLSPALLSIKGENAIKSRAVKNGIIVAR